MNEETYKLYKVASVSQDKQCNYVKPFDWVKFQMDYNPITKKPIIDEDIDAVKSALMRLNNSAGGEIVQCCDPNNTVADSVLLAKYKAKFPAIRQIIQNGVVKYIEVSTVPQDLTKGWETLTPYLLCRIGKTEFKTTDKPNIFRSVELVQDCYSRDCSQDTIGLEHLFNSARADMQFSYYDDAKAADAVRSGSVDGVAQYLRKYNNADLPLTHDEQENRLLHIAARYYKPDILQLILAVKPNLNIKNGNGDTPMHIAARYGNLDVLESLVKAGAEMNPKNNAGETPIILAVSVDKDQNRRMVYFLYNNGSSILDTDAAGNTILHHIITNAPDDSEKSGLVRFMLERGVSAEQANNAGLTPLELTGNLLAKYEPVPTYTGPTPAATISPYGTQPTIKHLPNKRPAIQRLEYVGPDLDGRQPGVEGFQVVEQKDSDLTPNQRELMEIQTMLFNAVIQDNQDKYGGYINVSDIPKGAPIEVLDYMCSGQSSKIQGLENKAECEALGGTFVKIKNPSTLVKLELVEVSKAEQDDLYYEKNPKPAPAKPVPTVETFTDFSGQYINRGELPTTRTFGTDNLQIYDTVPGFINDGNNKLKPGMLEPQATDVELSHPGALPRDAMRSSRAAEYNSMMLSEELSLAKQDERLKINILRENWQLVVSAIILVLILLFVIQFWFKPNC
jgi:hypothetical protein